MQEALAQPLLDLPVRMYANHREKHPLTAHVRSQKSFCVAVPQTNKHMDAERSTGLNTGQRAKASPAVQQVIFRYKHYTLDMKEACGCSEICYTQSEVRFQESHKPGITRGFVDTLFFASTDCDSELRYMKNGCLAGTFWKSQAGLCSADRYTMLYSTQRKKGHAVFLW